MVLVAIGAFLLAASWTGVFGRHRRKLNQAIESFQLETNKIKNDLKEFMEIAKDDIKKIEKNVKDEIKRETMQFSAGIVRLSVLAAYNAKAWDLAASWCSTAIVEYNKIKSESMVRTFVKLLIECLDKCKSLKEEHREEIRACLRSIPPILNEEKQKIEKRLKELPKEPPKQTKPS